MLLLFSSCLAWDFYYITGAPSFDKKELLPAIAVNSIMEHLPKGVLIDKLDKNREPHKETRFTIQGGGRVEVVTWKSAERVLDVTADEPLVVRFRTFNFPGWTAWLDEQKSEIKTEAGSGAILIDVPGGRHRIRLAFRDTPVRLAGKLISLATAIVIIILSVNIPRSRKGGMT